ncbi:MetQ/NlpA family ABC transporter substrate-binding protein [Corynebacterium pseudopelargi]|uniref:D-methionine-binding lipoprotein MetQ n=1 Tax=Corynebacterium pseudopelargi TaxID=2080757 RepID=A0A3G6J192_9CORY|nr:MetQ/NlpA family ABC transporter substrate-binding protein [Corynebacterium pseudopelargi]AZA09904.1 D-methionine-binding lipoprotein MetQ precursor [Corynebacterium pseudopelargi]
MKKILSTALAASLLSTGLVACSSDSNEASDTIKVGSTDSSQKAWQVWEDKAKEAGINLEVVNFADYSTPNQALSQHQIDANQFQHLKFLAEYNANTGEHLVPVGSSEVVPLALFWKDHDSLDGIEGENIAIPNDPTNQARALHVLAAADLITLKNKDQLSPTPADVDTKASKVTLTPVDAAQTPAAYGDGQPAIINNNFLDRAGIDAKTAIFKDDPASPEAEPYINVLVTTEDRADDPQLQQLVEIWHSPEVQEARKQDTKGTAYPIQRSQEDLQEILDKLEQDAKQQ